MTRVISRVTMVITYIRGLITPLITTHEPPSTQGSLESAQLTQDMLKTCENVDSIFSFVPHIGFHIHKSQSSAVH